MSEMADPTSGQMISHYLIYSLAIQYTTFYVHPASAHTSTALRLDHRMSSRCGSARECSHGVLEALRTSLVHTRNAVGIHKASDLSRFFFGIQSHILR